MYLLFLSRYILGNIRHLSAYQVMRYQSIQLPPPPRISPSCPHCLQAVTGQEYHYPYCLSSPYRELPNTNNQLFLARLSSSVMAQSLKWLAGFSNGNRKVSDKWYIQLSSYKTCHPQKEETGEENSIPSPVSSVRSYFLHLFLKIFEKIFYFVFCPLNSHKNRMYRTSFQLRDLLICQVIEIISNNPTTLYFRQ